MKRCKWRELHLGIWIWSWFSPQFLHVKPVKTHAKTQNNSFNSPCPRLVHVSPLMCCQPRLSEALKEMRVIDERLYLVLTIQSCSWAKVSIQVILVGRSSFFIFFGTLGVFFFVCFCDRCCKTPWVNGR